MSCTHVESSGIRPPWPTESVYREDCTRCFDSIDDPTGLDVCLHCYNGGCAAERNHSSLHAQSSQHPLVVNIKRTRKRVAREEPPAKLSKLEIRAETEEDRYDTTTQVRCHECKVEDIDLGSSQKLSEVVHAILKANTFARKEEVKAWEQEMVACEHTLCLEQQESRQIASQDLGGCSECDLKENLWLCLTCGNLGCGRAQFGGLGGHSHALAHSDALHHPVAVKLGSLTADGTADIYCYSCNEERVDPELPTHLLHWGINIRDRVKTEKSLTEMQIDENLRWEFSMTNDDGQVMKPIFGEGFTGLKNLGNSCYMNSTLQSLFAMPEFRERYYRPNDPAPPTSKPADDLETQLRKVADGLLSGRYSKPDPNVDVSESTLDVPFQRGLAPAMLKHLVGSGHPDFSTMQQQDAFHFLSHLLELITRSARSASSSDPVDAFRFSTEARLQCLDCKRVRYRTEKQENISIPVPIRRVQKQSTEDSSGTTKPTEEKEEFEPVTLKECLDIFTADEAVERTCEGCGGKSGSTKRTMFKTFPQILAVNARRFEVVGWVPTKKDVPVIVDDAPISFDTYKSAGLQEGEEILPSTGDDESSSKFVPNPDALAMLEAMEFPRVRCEKALHATGNSDAEAATNWLFAHMEDPDIDVPMNLDSSAGGSKNVLDPANIEALVNMGFGVPQARQALKETGSNMERAVDWLFSHPDAQGDMDDGEGTSAKEPEAQEFGSGALPANFELQSIVCHKGTSIHSGHYVAFVRKQIPEDKERSWVLFNDEKVAKASNFEEMKKFAYVYFFHRV